MEPEQNHYSFKELTDVILIYLFKKIYFIIINFYNYIFLNI